MVSYSLAWTRFFEVAAGGVVTFNWVLLGSSFDVGPWDEDAHERGLVLIAQDAHTTKAAFFTWTVCARHSWPRRDLPSRRGGGRSRPARESKAARPARPHRSATAPSLRLRPETPRVACRPPHAGARSREFPAAR